MIAKIGTTPRRPVQTGHMSDRVSPMSVGCPSCGAEPGERCRSRHVHKKRVKAAKWDPAGAAPQFRSASVRQDGRAPGVASVTSGGLPESRRQRH
ncbi:zinc finger domain-containing protein [Actinopolymorpha pittospori]